MFPIIPKITLLEEQGVNFKNELTDCANGIACEMYSMALKNGINFNEKVYPSYTGDVGGRFFVFSFGMVYDEDNTKFWPTEIEEISQDDFLDSYVRLNENT